jgi:L,D-peptidoglycan transpeptidase YkuD (ErfK/YbiS/YcfS/YnhG family)
MRAVALVVCVLAGCAPTPTASPTMPVRVGHLGPMPADALDAAQALVVWPATGEVFQARLTAWERGRGGWVGVFGPMPAVIGPKGFAPGGEKREGDGRTPSGTYRIGTAFGFEPAVDTKLDYRQTTADDFWVDDPASPQYNRWVHGNPDAKSFEKLRVDAYKYAAVIEYNTDPVKPGAGSAIFLHVWGGPDKATAGCVAVTADELKRMLGWLDKTKKPVIVLNP